MNLKLGKRTWARHEKKGRYRQHLCAWTAKFRSACTVWSEPLLLADGFAWNSAPAVVCCSDTVIQHRKVTCSFFFVFFFFFCILNCIQWAQRRINVDATSWRLNYNVMNQDIRIGPVTDPRSGVLARDRRPRVNTAVQGPVTGRIRNVLIHDNFIN